MFVYKHFEYFQFDLPEREFEPQIFCNFPAHDLNFHGKEPEIKSKQASKRDRIFTFLTIMKHFFQYSSPKNWTLIHKTVIKLLFIVYQVNPKYEFYYAMV